MKQAIQINYPFNNSRVHLKPPFGGPWLLHPIEWDFRSITAREFDHAVLYEFARSCPLVCDLWAKWLNSTLPRNRVVQLELPTAYDDEKRRISVRQMFDKYAPLGVEPDPTKRDGFQAHLASAFPTELRLMGLADFLLKAPAFPEPWLTLTAAQIKSILEVPLGPATGPAFREAEDIPGYPPEPHFKVVIDFTMGLERIEATFARWLRAKRSALRQQRLIPAKVKQKTGPAANGNYALLTMLAAYRFAAEGITYKAGRDEVDRMKLLECPEPALCGLPDYTTPSSRSVAVGEVESRLERLFVVPPPADFVRISPPSLE